MTLREAAQALRDRRLSSVELTKMAIERIDKVNPSLNAFLTVFPQSALDQAVRADRERATKTDRGPLHGIPVAIKDMFDMRGVRTTAGSRILDYVPKRDAAVVEKLEAAGAVIVGKLHMHELAFGITSDNPHFGPVRNPWNMERIPGGSSGGAGAAIASDLIYAAIASDTGGSVRVPASYCGTVGLKPTYGRISRYGSLPLSFSLDHVGVLTQDVRDAAVVLRSIAGRDPRDPSSANRPVVDYTPEESLTLKGLRLGFPENYFFDRLENDVELAVRGAIARAGALGATLKPVRMPDISAMDTVGQVILLAEAAAVYGPHMQKRTKFGPDVMALLDQGQLLPAVDYINAQRVRRKLQLDFARVWKDVDCLIMPTTPNTAPRIGEVLVRVGGQDEDIRHAATRFVRPFNVLGLPALSIPCGLSAFGLPIGLQLVAPPFAESPLLQLGAVLQDGGVGIPPVPTPKDAW